METRERASSSFGLDGGSKVVVHKDKSYVDIVSRTRQKLQIIKALKVMRKTSQMEKLEKNVEP